MISKLDKVVELEHKRDEVVRALSYAQVMMNLLSMEDELFRHSWTERGQLCATWASEAESHMNTMIDVLLND